MKERMMGPLSELESLCVGGGDEDLDFRHVDCKMLTE